jgi:hypothetical protein
VGTFVTLLNEFQISAVGVTEAPPQVFAINYIELSAGSLLLTLVILVASAADSSAEIAWFPTMLSDVTASSFSL